GRVVTGVGRGGDLHAGGVEVNQLTVVGEVGLGVRVVAGGDGHGLGHTGRGAVVRVLALVAGGDRVADAGLDGLRDGGVQRLVLRATQAHVGDGGTVGVVGHPVDALDDLLGGAGALVVQHP